jgi:hypothetical protein
VNAGGDLRVSGEDAYAVAIRNPRTLAATGPHMEIRNEALATSAHYVSSQCSDGETPGQHVDSRDGRPLTGRFSVSVCAPACMIADALTKVVAASADSRNPLLKRFGERSRVTWSVLHWSVGLAFPTLLLLHIGLGRKSSAGATTSGHYSGYSGTDADRRFPFPARRQLQMLLRIIIIHMIHLVQNPAFRANLSKEQRCRQTGQ